MLSSWVRLSKASVCPLVLNRDFAWVKVVGPTGNSRGPCRTCLKSERKLGAEQGLGLGLAHKASCPLPQGCHAFSCTINTNPVAYRNQLFPELIQQLRQAVRLRAGPWLGLFWLLSRNLLESMLLHLLESQMWQWWGVLTADTVPCSRSR